MELNHMILTGDRWFTMPIGDYGMENLDLRSFYDLGRAIGNLKRRSTGAEKPALDVIAMGSLWALLKEATTSKTLPLLQESAEALLPTLDSLISEVMPWEEHITGQLGTQTQLLEKLDEFEVILRLQFKKMHTYRVTKRGALDPATLIETPGESIENEDWEQLPPSAKSDWESACRCLAFDLPTASGFHLLRCVEAVALSYVDRMGLPRPKSRNLNSYLELLRENGASPAKIDAAQQIRVLYRNPLMHPEDTLNLPDAMDLFGLCRAMIRVLIGDMREKGLLKPAAAIAFVKD